MKNNQCTDIPKKYKICLNCKFFKNTEEVFDGYIEHKNKNGKVWLQEPKHKTVPRHCTIHPEAFTSWWNVIKDTPSSEIDVTPNCNDFEMSEGFKELQLPLIKMIEMANEILNKDDKG